MLHLSGRARNRSQSRPFARGLEQMEQEKVAVYSLYFVSHRQGNERAWRLKRVRTLLKKGGGKKKEKSREDCLACARTLIEYRDERRKERRKRMEGRAEDKVMSNRARKKYEFHTTRSKIN